MSADDGYRDALAAAHSRIEQLEREAAHHRAASVHAATLAALHRERAHVVGELQTGRNWERPFLFRVGAPVAILATVFALAGDWLFASLGLALDIAAWFGLKALVRGRASDAANQLVLVDTEIARLTSALESTAPAAAGSAPTSSAGETT